MRAENRANGPASTANILHPREPVMDRVNIGTQKVTVPKGCGYLRPDGIQLFARFSSPSPAAVTHSIKPAASRTLNPQSLILAANSMIGGKL